MGAAGNQTNSGARIALGAVFALAMAFAAAGGLRSAYGQVATVKGAGDEMKVLYSTPTEIAEGGRVAESACKTCHGANGISATKDVPHIAGQRAPYMYLELKAYKQGARGSNPMAAAVKYMSEDSLMKAAAYYASLDPAQPSATGAKPVPRPDPVQVGEVAAADCAGCHGEKGVTENAGSPNLVGLDPKYLVAAMVAYKTGDRKDDLMKGAVENLSDTVLNNIALYYALQKPARAKTTAEGDAAAGKAAAAECAGCHGEQGVSAKPAIPSLAGQDADYFIAAMEAYKDGRRKDESMKGFAAKLGAASLKNLAAYYASLTPKAPNVRKPMTIAEIAERCDRCHGLNGNSVDPRTPMLAAQRPDYLEKALHAYRDGRRKSTAMAAMSELLGESDVEAVAAHYSRQKARAVVYVTLPGK
jgi:cytochrome c553